MKDDKKEGGEKRRTGLSEYFVTQNGITSQGSVNRNTRL